MIVATQTQTLTAQERLERMEALVRKMAAYSGTMFRGTEWVEEARALVAEMEPVVDGDLVEAREIAASECLMSEGPDSLPVFIRRGDHDDHDLVRTALRSLKRGRVLARGDVA